MIRRKFWVVCVLTALMLSTVIGTPPAYAACPSSGCNGQDPATTGCSSGAITPTGDASEPISINGRSVGYVEIRWKGDPCYANWSRVTITDGVLRTTKMWIEDRNGNRYGYQQETQYYQAWSDMKVDNGTDVRACGSIGSSLDFCSGWY